MSADQEDLELGDVFPVSTTPVLTKTLQIYIRSSRRNLDHPARNPHLYCILGILTSRIPSGNGPRFPSNLLAAIRYGDITCAAF